MREHAHGHQQLQQQGVGGAQAGPAASADDHACRGGGQRPPGILSHAETRALLSQSFGWHCSRGGKLSNEDRAAAFRAQEGSPVAAARCAVVADGHGGPDTAAAVLSLVQEALVQGGSGGGGGFSGCWSAATQQAALQSRLDALEQQLCPLMCEHQGTTLTLLVLPDRGRRGLVWWVGDSPAYRVHEDEHGVPRAELLIRPHNQHHAEERSRLAAQGVHVSAAGNFAVGRQGEDLIGVCRMVRVPLPLRVCVWWSG